MFEARHISSSCTDSGVGLPPYLCFFSQTPSLRDCGQNLLRLNAYFSPNPLSSRLRAEPARSGSGCRRTRLRMPMSCPLASAPGCLHGQRLSLSIRCSIILSTGTHGGPQGCSHLHGIMCDRGDVDVEDSQWLWTALSQGLRPGPQGNTCTAAGPDRGDLTSGAQHGHTSVFLCRLQPFLDSSASWSPDTANLDFP